jgi:molybdopterin-guanine dinucleotide biosynthesis protein A
MNYAPQSTAPAPVGAFLLAGGASSRMGRDKALIPFRGNPLLVHLAELLRSVSVDFHIIAPPQRYESFAYPILPDLRDNCGPMAAIETALAHSSHPWNFIVACDMPLLSAEWLITLRDAALGSTQTDCVSSATAPDSPNPLAAIWNRSALPTVRGFLDEGNFRVRSLLSSLETKILIPPDPQILANWNRPEDISGLGGEGKANSGR